MAESSLTSPTPTATTGPSRRSANMWARSSVPERARDFGDGVSRGSAAASTTCGACLREPGDPAIEPARTIAVRHCRVLGLPVTHVTQPPRYLGVVRRDHLQPLEEPFHLGPGAEVHLLGRAVEDTAELPSHSLISFAVFCL